MNRKTFIFSLFLFITAINVAANNNDPLGYKAKADSLLRVVETAPTEKKIQLYRHLYSISIRVNDVANQRKYIGLMIDAATAVNDTLEIVTSQKSLLIFYYNQSMVDSLMLASEPTMEYFKKSGYWDQYFEIFVLRIQTLNGENKLDQAAADIEKMYDEAAERNHIVGMGRAKTFLGMFYSAQERYNEAEKAFVEAIGLLKHSNGDKMNEVYHSYSILLGKQERHQDRLKLLKEYAAYVENLDKIRIKKRHMPLILDDYYVNVGYLQTYLALDSVELARKYHEKLAAAPLLNSPFLKQEYLDAAIRLHLKQKEYKEALEVMDTLEGLLNETENKQEEVILYAFRIEAYRNLNNIEKLDETYQKLIAHNDSIKSIEINAQLDELRTRYEVDRLVLEKENQRTYTLAAIGGCLLLLVALTIYIMYSRKLEAKNRRLYQQIQEALRKEKQAEKTLATAPVETLTREAELYRRLSELMQTERLFTQSDIDRKALADRLGTNERYLADAIRQESDETVSAYITRLRLQYALELLETRTELTLEAVATESGHASYSPFYRAFGKMYGMSPSEYRKFSTKKNIKVP